MKIPKTKKKNNSFNYIIEKVVILINNTLLKSKFKV